MSADRAGNGTATGSLQVVRKSAQILDRFPATTPASRRPRRRGPDVAAQDGQAPGVPASTGLP